MDINICLNELNNILMTRDREGKSSFPFSTYLCNEIIIYKRFVIFNILNKLLNIETQHCISQKSPLPSGCKHIITHITSINSIKLNKFINDVGILQKTEIKK